MEKGIRAACSPALLAAQKELFALRSEIGISTARSSRPIQQPNLAFSSRDCGRLPVPLPEHLGWGSQPLSELLKRGSRSGNQASGSNLGQSALPCPIDDTGSDARPAKPQTRAVSPAAEQLTESSVRLYPDIALAILKNRLTPVGRIWLMLGYLDTNGRGWLEEATIRTQLGDRKAVLGVCSRRQLRKLLARGEGIFWTRDKGRLWLRSVAKIAASLGVFHLAYSPVELPVQVLRESIGQVRAHFYASLHSGRAAAGNQGKPISRAAIEELSSVSRRTQQLYERRIGVSRHRNYAIGGCASKNDYQELAWQHGRALFPFLDKKGLFGTREKRYAAWRLPNSYRGPHEKRSVGRRKRINRELADLFSKGITGNDKRLDESCSVRPRNRVPIYHKNGSSAATAYNRDPYFDYYWRRRKRIERHHGSSSGQNRLDFWFVIPGKATL